MVLNDHYSVYLNPLLEMDSLGACGLVACVRLPSQPMTEREQRAVSLTALFLCLCEPLTAPHSDERTTADQLPHEHQRNRQRGDQEHTQNRLGRERLKIAS